MATVTYVVKKGDTLSQIAQNFGTTVNNLVALNNISNPNLIHPGQTLYISGKPSTTATTTTKSTASYAVWFTGYGIQSNSDNAYVAWNFDKAWTKEYNIEWDYYTNGIWFTGARNTVSNANARYNDVYSPPSNATSVRVRVKPVSETYKSGDQEISRWIGVWTSYQVIDIPKEDSSESYTPPTPPTPEVTIEGYKLTCKVDNLNAIQYTGHDPYVEFNVIKNDVQCVNVAEVKVIYFAASYSCNIDAGYSYKVRARIKQGPLTSEWSSYSSNDHTQPNAPSGITSCRATSATSVSLAWTAVSSAETYEIQYATNKDYFNGSNATQSIQGIESTQYEITGLESGQRYYFRVRATNSKGSSSWTSPVSVIIGSKPGAPTTWSSTTTAISGEELIFYWIHNTTDDSKEVMAELEIYCDSTLISKTITNEDTDTDSDEIKTSQYVMDTTYIVDGAVIKWRVRTMGITNEFGDWSVQRTVNVYAPPTLALEVLDKDGENLYVLESFPFHIKGVAGPSTQTPVSFHVSIVAKGSYETVDEVGTFKMVSAGDEVYSGFFDIDHDLDITILPNNVDLQSDIEYELTCIVAMDSGLTAKESRKFTVSWVDEIFSPNAEISYDPDTAVAYIRPFCEYYPYLFYQVDYVDETWVKTDTVINEIEGISVDNAFTEENHIVYAGYLDNVLTHFCIVKSTDPVSVPDITLSVYRREFDGKFTEIGSGLVNEENTFVTDPHPSLDFARYRVVAISNATGSISYTDLPGYYVNEKAVIIQWDERWSNYEASNEGAIVDPPWAGSMLRLLYNVDVSDSNTSDVSLVNYIGREHPVSYYGTQLGVKSTWSMVIPKNDTETLYNIRRLSRWIGDVYVREPSGSGYWANVSVSFSQTHCDILIPITMEITRVEGGV